MTTTTLPLPSQAGYRTALREAKKAGIVAGRNPKADDLELLISQFNTDRLMLDRDHRNVAGLIDEAELRIAAIDWAPILALPTETRRSLYASICACLADEWGV